MRLDKFLVACAVGSRTRSKTCSRAGRVTVNGKKKSRLNCRLMKKEMRFALMGKCWSMKRVCLLHDEQAPRVISATEDPKHRTVLDLLDDIARSKEVFPSRTLGYCLLGLFTLD